MNLTLAQLWDMERPHWGVDRASRCGITRFTRLAGPTVLDDGTILPDFTLDAPLKHDAGDKEDGRLWVDFYAVNPAEIVPGYRIRIAWDAFVARIGEFHAHPRMLAGHNTGRPIGNWPEVRMERDGTWMRGFISSAPGMPAEMQGLARDGAVDGSIGFDFTEADYDEKENVLDVREGVLLEGSLVGLPAMKSSFVRVAKMWAEEAAGKMAAEQPSEIPGAGARPRVAAPDWGAMLSGEASMVASVARARAALARAGA